MLRPMLLVVSLGLLSACAEPILGTWKGESGDSANPNVMKVTNGRIENENGRKVRAMVVESTINFVAGDSDLLSVDFEGVAEPWKTTQASTESDPDYTVTMENPDDSTLNFVMSCFLDGPDAMDCEGDGSWSRYAFRWERK